MKFDLNKNKNDVDLPQSSKKFDLSKNKSEVVNEKPNSKKSNKWYLWVLGGLVVLACVWLLIYNSDSQFPQKDVTKIDTNTNKDESINAANNKLMDSAKQETPGSVNTPSQKESGKKEATSTIAADNNSTTTNKAKPGASDSKALKTETSQKMPGESSNNLQFKSTVSNKKDAAGLAGNNKNIVLAEDSPKSKKISDSRGKKNTVIPKVLPKNTASSEGGKSNVVYNFEFNNSEISAGNKEIESLLKYMTENKDVVINVVGHTDGIGKKNYNLDLSKRRAKALFDYLIGKGISSDRVKYSGVGDQNPIKDNLTKQGRAQNRRVEYQLVK